MKGAEFESLLCSILKDHGYWALNIPKNQSGAQPFDVVALRNKHICGIDCKVCSDKTGYFSFSRIEDNQWLAFEMFNARVTGTVGIAIFHDWKIYFYEHAELKRLNAQKSGLTVDPVHLWFDADEVKRGYVLWKR